MFSLTPPPPSPTFSVSPGGLCAIAKSPWKTRKLHVASLSKWESMGRILVLQVAHTVPLLAIVIYGFPCSHSLNATNDVMFAECFHWVSGQNQLAIVVGDFNESVDTSSVIALCNQWKLWRVSGTAPTTKGKNRPLARSAAIDHAFCNSKALDLGFFMDVDYGFSCSDRYPITGRIFLPVASYPLVWCWPAPSKPCLNKKPAVTWGPSSPTSLTEWSTKASRWVSEAFGLPSQRHVDHRYQAIAVAMRSLESNLRARSPTIHMKASARRKMIACGVVCEDPEEALKELQDKLQDLVEADKRKALADWRVKVKTWHKTSAELFRYLRNAEPSKACLVIKDGAPIADAPLLHKALNQYWSQIESWPSPDSLTTVIEMLVDHYAIFIPRHEAQVTLTPDALHKRVREAKQSELKTLPHEAWTDLVCVLLNCPEVVPAALMMMFRRVPIGKGDNDLPTVKDWRPIDVYSMVMRTVSSVLVGSLKIWKMHVLHPTQYACSLGAIYAMQRVGLVSEKVLHNGPKVWCASVDFSKLFNMISCDVASRAAQLMGLDPRSCELLSLPIKSSMGYWRLPLHEVGPMIKIARGLPQGLSASVLYAEVFTSLFLWRLSTTTDVESVAYVEHITLIATSPESLNTALRQLMGFEATFCLDVSLLKTHLWGSQLPSLVGIAESWGFSVKESVEVLGHEWALYPTSKCRHEKGLKRLDRALDRLQRLSHLLAPLTVKSHAILAGCLSLLDHAPTLPVVRTKSLRSAVRKALGLTSGAPEVVYGVHIRGSLDPWIHWLLTPIRLWHFVACSEDAPILDSLLPRRTQSTLVLARAEVQKIGLNLDRYYLFGYDMQVPLAWLWSVCRPLVLRLIKRANWIILEKRRPKLYSGIQNGWVREKSHSKLLESFDSYSAKVIMRVWSGVALTRLHQNTIDPSIDPTCECGETQDMRHLLYDCACTPLIPEHLRYWKGLPSSRSAALLYSRELDLNHWKQMCKKAVHVLTKGPRGQQEEEQDLGNWDHKGHDIVVESTGACAYCSKCHIFRVIRDQEFIATRPCAKDAPPLREGETGVRDGIEVRLEIRQWKRTSKRPFMTCTTCKKGWWATTANVHICR